MENENNLVIQKVNKVNTIVILDKDSYLKSAETVLKDSSNLKKIPAALDRNLSYVVNLEKRNDLLKKLQNKYAISERVYNKLRPVGTKPGTRYGTAKVHKPLTLCISESCIKIKINLNVYVHTSLWCLKRFYEGLSGF